MHHTNLPVTPGAIIGYRRNGTPIRLIAGGSGEGDEGSSAEGQEGSAGNSGGDAGTGQQDQGGTSDRDGSRTDGDDDKTVRTVAAIREEFKAERSKRQATEKALADFKAESEAREKARAEAETERNRKLAIALGVAKEDEPPDPAKLLEELERKDAQHQSELSQRDSGLRQTQVELAVLRNASKHGGNGDALLDSRNFMAKVSGLDPAAPEFEGLLADEIKAAVESSPQYKAAAPAPSGNGNGTSGNGERKPPAPSRSGGEHIAPGGNRQWTIEDVRAVRASNDPATAAKAIDEAVNSGLLVDLGYSPSKNRR